MKQYISFFMPKTTISLKIVDVYMQVVFKEETFPAGDGFAAA